MGWIDTRDGSDAIDQPRRLAATGVELFAIGPDNEGGIRTDMVKDRQQTHRPFLWPGASDLSVPGSGLGPHCLGGSASFAFVKLSCLRKTKCRQSLQDGAFPGESL